MRTEGVLMQYERKHKEERPVLAICYDFDKTLTPNNIVDVLFLILCNFFYSFMLILDI